MSLTVLRITATPRAAAAPAPGQAVAPAPEIYNVAGSTLLALVADVVAPAWTSETAGNGNSEESPITGLDSPKGWQRAINALQASREQWIRVAGKLVRKAPGKYYMNEVGVEGRGIEETGGPTYNQLRGVRRATGLSDGAFATAVRHALEGHGSDQVGVAGMAAALFLAEPRRNRRSFLINLMLLDFLENQVTYGAGKTFSWDSVLWRDDFGGADQKQYTFSTGVSNLEAHQRGGKLPMSHTFAARDGEAALPAPPSTGLPVLYTNAEQEKEATIVIRWLMLALRRAVPQHVVGGARALGTGAGWGPNAAKAPDVTYDLAYDGLQQGGGPGFQYWDAATGNASFPALVKSKIGEVLRSRNTGFAKRQL